MTGGPPVREPGWAGQPGVTVLAGRQLARRVSWFTSALRDVPGLIVEGADAECVRLAFATPARARRFHRALVAESMPAAVDGRHVELRVEAWYTPADVRSLALAVAKVGHYLER